MKLLHPIRVVFASFPAQKCNRVVPNGMGGILKARRHLFHRLLSRPARSCHGSFHRLNPMPPRFGTKREGVEEAFLRSRLPSSMEEGPQGTREAVWKKVIR
jgi:hypothetical protein